MILISASIGTETWTVNTFGLLGATGENVTCRGTRTLGLFNGVDNFHTSGDCFKKDVVAIDVLTEDTLSFNRSLLFAVISFLGVALFFLVTVVAVSSYNLCARPYETYAGPIGLLVYLSTVGKNPVFTFLFVLLIRESSISISHGNCYK
uniref:Clarin-3-like n=1 Tax=Phallusia mammillata TaxID=59560 RepID=A0A6F9D903_9ASCI|nr:clarin-3-like [Phallusia mammillata]